MSKLALFVKLHAKPGKEKEVETFLRQGLAIVLDEPETQTWFALRFSPSIFGIFDTFENEHGREAHLEGRVSAALVQKAGELLLEAPVIEKVDILADKIPD